MQTFHGIVQGNTVLIADDGLKEYEGKAVTVTLALHNDAALARKRAAFRRFAVRSAQIREHLGRDFDPQKELTEALDEKYDHTA